MSNPYYTKTGQPASQTQGRSDVIRAEYSLIEAGFDAAYAAILLRATSASPTFTGTVNASGATTVTVPTEANLADSTTKAASTAFVQGVLGAAGALLPVQTGFTALYSLKTNGTVASWTLTLPAQASNSGKFLGTNGAAESWLMVGMARQAATGTLAIGLADNRTIIDCSGTFTATFAAPATLTTGWHAILRNTGSGNVTVAHTSGNIDGLTSYVMYPGEARLFQCDASTIRSQVLNPYNVTYTSGANTFTKPPGYAYHEGELWAGGGGGSVGAAAPGGGGGACTPFKLRDSVMGATETITIGAGGTGSATGTPSAGSASTIGSRVRAGCARAATTTNGGVAMFFSAEAANLATLSGLEFTSAGASGPTTWGGGSGEQSSSGYGTVWGGAAGAKQGSTAIPSVFGGQGGAPGTTGVGSPGTAPGGGGGATNSGANGGAGASGECRIRGLV